MFIESITDKTNSLALCPYKNANKAAIFTDNVS